MPRPFLRDAILFSLASLAAGCGETSVAPAPNVPAAPRPIAVPAPEATPPPAPADAAAPAPAPSAPRSPAPDAAALPNSTEWLPGDAALWTLEWSDEFDGPAGDETHPNTPGWYPMLGWTPEDFKNKNRKGLRWDGKTDATAWFYSTKTGNHWLDGQGNLILRAVADKTDPNDLGPRVNTAYLQTGYPARWNPQPDAEHKVIWEPGDGVFVSPTVDGEVRPLYIVARLRADQVEGWSTWFAFWLFSHTRSYNNVPADGTEVDVLEIVKGRDHHFNNFINVANHWYPKGKVKEDKYFNEHTTPKTSQFVTVDDGNYHAYQPV